MQYHAVFFVNNGLAPFIGQDGAEAALIEAADRAGLSNFSFGPLRHRSRRLVLRDAADNLVAVVQPLRRPF